MSLADAEPCLHKQLLIRLRPAWVFGMMLRASGILDMRHEPGAGPAGIIQMGFCTCQRLLFMHRDVDSPLGVGKALVVITRRQYQKQF